MNNPISPKEQEQTNQKETQDKKRKRETVEESKMRKKPPIPWIKADYDIFFSVLQTRLPFHAKEWEDFAEEFNRLRNGPYERSAVAIKRKFEILAKGTVKGFLTPEQKTAKAILKKIEEKVHGLTAPTMVGCDDSESEEDDIEEIESDSSQNIIPDPLPPRKKSRHKQQQPQPSFNLPKPSQNDYFFHFLSQVNNLLWRLEMREQTTHVLLSQLSTHLSQVQHQPISTPYSSHTTTTKPSFFVSPSAPSSVSSTPSPRYISPPRPSPRRTNPSPCPPSA